jgi:hypothetical protein
MLLLKIIVEKRYNNTVLWGVWDTRGQVRRDKSRVQRTPWERQNPQPSQNSFAINVFQRTFLSKGLSRASELLTPKPELILKTGVFTG